MPGTYLNNVLDRSIVGNDKEPNPTEHRSGATTPAVDAADPVDASGACQGAGWSQVTATWSKVGGGATATLDLQVLLWDSVAETWNAADSITSVSPGQVIGLPIGGCRFFVKIVGVHDVTGISAWKILLRPWTKF